MGRERIVTKNQIACSLALAAVGTFVGACGGGGNSEQSFEELFITPTPTVRLLPTSTEAPVINEGDGEDDYVQPKRVEIGEVAPEFKFTNNNGEVVNFSQFLGEPIVMLIRRDKCGPCNDVMARISEIRQEFDGSDLQYLILQTHDSDDEPARMEADATVLYADSYEVLIDFFFYRGYPETLFFSEDGVLQSAYSGSGVSDLALRNTIRELISGEIVPDSELVIDAGALGMPLMSESEFLGQVLTDVENLYMVSQMTFGEAEYAAQQLRDVYYQTGGFTPFEIFEGYAKAGEVIAEAFCIEPNNAELTRVMRQLATNFYKSYSFFLSAREIDNSSWPGLAMRFNPDCDVSIFPTEN